MFNKNCLETFYVVIISAVIFLSCKPKIYSFKPEQTTISEGDTIKLHWKTRGHPTLLVHEKTSLDDPANIKSGEKLLEFILGFKNSDIYCNTKVVVGPKEASDTIYFSHSTINKDTLTITSLVSPKNLFLIQSVSSIMDREIILWHDHKMITLHHIGDHSSTFNNTEIGGIWRIATLLSPSEIQDPKIRPRGLQFVINKKHK